MDFNFRGRTWAGNIYHRFETMCQEVDDFVTKDSMKYVENHVQTIGESMKKLYSNVVDDFLPPVEDDKPNEGQLVTEKQNDVLGTCIGSSAGIKGKCGHVDETNSLMEQGDASEVSHQRQGSLPPNLAFRQQAETGFYSEGGGNICISKNAEVVRKENVTEEESPVSRFSSSQDKKSSLNLREQHQLSESSDSTEGENLSGSIEISSDPDQRSIFLTNCSPGKFVEDVDFSCSQNDETVCYSDDLSEDAKTGLSFEQDGVNAILKNANMGPEENAANAEHPMSECADTFGWEDSVELTSFTKERLQMADDSHPQRDENSLVLATANEGFKSNIQGKLSPIMFSHDTGLRVVQVEQTISGNVNSSEAEGANLSLEHHENAAKLGITLEENVEKDVPLLVEHRSFSNDRSCSKLSLCSREQCPSFEESSNLENENLNESLLVPINENHTATIWAEFPSATSVQDQQLGGFQDEESLCDIADPLREAEKDLSLEIDGDHIGMYSDMAGEENHTLTKYELEASFSSLELKSSPDLYLPSTKLHLQAEELDSFKDDNFSKSSPPLRAKDHKNTVLTNISQAMTAHDAELRSSKTDEIIYSPRPFSELVASNIRLENKIADAEVTSLNSVAMESSNPPDISSANYAQKAEKSSYNCADSSSRVSYISSMSSGAFSDLADGNKAVNLIPAFLSRAVSAVSSGHGDESTVDITDSDMETVDLSDKVNLDESCIIVDNRLHYAASSRPRKFRSYKKLIQDVFASRKRLIKEYEQLAILYGDIETEIYPHPKQSLLPPVIATTSSSRTSQTIDMCEPEWELL